jgi:hypothetical protein
LLADHRAGFGGLVGVKPDLLHMILNVFFGFLIETQMVILRIYGIILFLMDQPKLILF